MVKILVSLDAGRAGNLGQSSNDEREEEDKDDLKFENDINYGYMLYQGVVNAQKTRLRANSAFRGTTDSTAILFFKFAKYFFVISQQLSKSSPYKLLIYACTLNLGTQNIISISISISYS